LSKTVWRIAQDALTYEADDLSGAGAKKDGGRWNEVGISVTYASETCALACLETFVHLNAGGLPLNRYLVEITIPDDIWASAQVEIPSSLRVGWDAEPAGRVSIQFGTVWVRSGSSALLVVPSVIVPEERNVVINPAHPDSVRITASKRRKWLYDPRMTKPEKISQHDGEATKGTT
jgi:RES domain-containing protein